MLEPVFSILSSALMRNDAVAISDIDRLRHRSIQQIAPSLGQLEVLIGIGVVVWARRALQHMPGEYTWHTRELSWARKGSAFATVGHTVPSRDYTHVFCW